MNEKELYSIHTYISSLETVAKCDSEENIGTALSLVTSSHSPIFIYSKKNEFIGIVSPYQALYSHRYPYTTKVSSIVTMPPTITNETSLYDVATYMLMHRVYLLPVFTADKKISGAIKVQDILQGIIRDSDFLTSMSRILTPRRPITAHQDATVGEIYQTMRDKKVSRVVLVDDEGDLAGLVSRRDLIPSLVKPTPKQRFGKNGFAPTDWAFDEEKEFRKKDPVRTFATGIVDTLPSDSPRTDVVKHLVLSPYNSILLTDKKNKPVGFLSLHDILKGISSLPAEDINLIMNKPSISVAQEDVEKAEEHLKKFGQKMNKRVAIEKIEVHFEEPKYASGQTAEFNTSVIVTPTAGISLRAKTKRKSFIESTQAATEQIRKQERRSGLTREESTYAIYKEGTIPVPYEDSYFSEK